MPAAVLVLCGVRLLVHPRLLPGLSRVPAVLPVRGWGVTALTRTFHLALHCTCGAGFACMVNAAAADVILRHWREQHRGAGHRRCSAAKERGQ